MLSVKEARTRLLAALTPVGQEEIPLERSGGRILAKGVTADLDLPPFSNSAMDGFAARAVDVAGAARAKPIVLEVIGDIPAGKSPSESLGPGQVMRIMTGAPLPDGADLVIPVEDTDFGDQGVGLSAPNKVKIFRPAKKGAHIRWAGEDLSQGQGILNSGHRLRPQDIGMLATLGWDIIPVYRRPKVAILSTGDELVPVTGELPMGKIRESNSYALAVQVESAGGEALRLGIVGDEAKAVKNKLDQAVSLKVDLIISSAGVSVGAFDYVRSVVESFGNLSFWRVNMRPGKPFVFGDFRHIPFVGLPGNPVSAFIGFEVFVRQAIYKLAGLVDWKRPTFRGTIEEEVRSDGRESFLRGVLREQDGRSIIRLTGHQGSGNLFSLVQANVIFIVPAGVELLAQGAEVDYWLLES
jgi:molybdopterin molybdotransferase